MVRDHFSYAYYFKACRLQMHWARECRDKARETADPVYSRIVQSHVKAARMLNRAKWKAKR